MYDNFIPVSRGAETPDYKENPKETFEVEVMQTMQRHASVKTNDYYTELDYDEDGRRCDNILTDETDWKEVLKDNDIPTPLRLIEILKEVLEGGAIYINERETKHLIEECKEWTAVETYIEEV